MQTTLFPWDHIHTYGFSQILRSSVLDSRQFSLNEFSCWWYWFGKKSGIAKPHCELHVCLGHSKAKEIETDPDLRIEVPEKYSSIFLVGHPFWEVLGIHNFPSSTSYFQLQWFILRAQIKSEHASLHYLLFGGKISSPNCLGSFRGERVSRMSPLLETPEHATGSLAFAFRDLQVFSPGYLSAYPYLPMKPGSVSAYIK